MVRREPNESGSVQGRAVTGPGRALVAVYGIFAVSASARAAYQVCTDFSSAPVAYSLSAFAALVYVVATVALARTGSWMRSLALVAVVIELVGVLLVGVLSVAFEQLFVVPTVWSGFGAGYGYVPVVLPVVGLWWLLRQRR